MARAVCPAGPRLAAAVQWMDAHAPVRAGCMLTRLFGSQAGAPPPSPPPASGTAASDAGTAAQQQPGSEDERAASLPVEQLAKALLAGNARGQLTTIAAGDLGAEDSKVHSSVVSYLSPRGECPSAALSIVVPADLPFTAQVSTHSARPARCMPPLALLARLPVSAAAMHPGTLFACASRLPGCRTLYRRGARSVAGWGGGGQPAPGKPSGVRQGFAGHWSHRPTVVHSGRGCDALHGVALPRCAMLFCACCRAGTIFCICPAQRHAGLACMRQLGSS